MGERPFALFPWRAGEILCQARITPDVARTVGAKVAEIHRAGATFARRDRGDFGSPTCALDSNALRGRTTPPCGRWRPKSVLASIAPSEREIQICHAASFTAICSVTMCSGRA